MKESKLVSVICCAILVLMSIVLVIMRNHEKSNANEVVQYIPIETQPEETIDVTEITMDKRNFLCFGDIDLEISDLGVVTFTCRTEEKKVIITANPVELFVTQYIKTVDEPEKDIEE